jgi:hypothetical protein
LREKSLSARRSYLVTLTFGVAAVSALLVVLCYYAFVSASSRLCANLPGSPSDIASTPRGDRDVEQLAVRISDSVTANQKTYARLLKDITEIRNTKSTLREVRYQPGDDGSTLIVKMSGIARALLALGFYRKWDCLNAYYRVRSIDHRSLKGVVLLNFAGVYDLRRLAELYVQLPGIKRAEPNALILTDSRRNLCVTPDGESWHYVLRDTVDRRLHYLVTTPEDVLAIDTWLVPDSAREFESRPSWVEKYWNEIACD